MARAFCCSAAPKTSGKTPAFDDFSARDSMKPMAWDDFLSATPLQATIQQGAGLYGAIDPSWRLPVRQNPACADVRTESPRDGPWSMFCFDPLDGAGEMATPRLCWTGGVGCVMRHGRPRATTEAAAPRAIRLRDSQGIRRCGLSST